MKFRAIFRTAAVLAAIVTCSMTAFSQGVKRIVLIKIDGLPGYYVDKYVRERDPSTGRSVLPWIDHIFYKNGSRVENFYTRGMSLSGPSWGLLDTGQHLQIKGNVEYDRYTLHPYDYLNFLPYYREYWKGNVADMPGAEVMDQLRIPLLVDAFPVERRYNAPQLYQRGNSWEIIGKGAINLFPKNAADLIDEWTIGLNFRRLISDQLERDIADKVTRDHFDYFDYYDTSFDHISHHNSDTYSRLVELKTLDATIGKIWTAIEKSPRADETAIVLVSDHGFNSEPNVTSQGFNLVKLLGSPAGGGHHVVTKRRLMLDYTVKGLYPLVPLIRTASKNSYYLEGRQGDYPTALLDFDGNERSSIHLRDSDLNLLQILHQQLQNKKLEGPVRKAATDEFFRVLDKNRVTWRRVATELAEELGAVRRTIETQRATLKAMETSAAKDDHGFGQQTSRLKSLISLDEKSERDHGRYVATLNRLLSLDRNNFDPRRVKVEEIIMPGSMGEQNSLYDLEHYVVGLSPQGLTLDQNGRIDVAKSFVTVNYFQLLHDQTVRSNVQEKVGNRPVDLVAARIDARSFSNLLVGGDKVENDPVWLYGSEDKQALILWRVGADGQKSYRYVPISNLTEDAAGRMSWEVCANGPGLPLKYLEDRDLTVPAGDRAEWLTSWHTEREWMAATHRTMYSNAVIGLVEQLTHHENSPRIETDDERLMLRFRDRQRRLTEADVLILANDHWNFDVRGFNPGGNHGSYFRVSTNSTLMFAGGAKTRIPRGLTVTEPYDSLDLVPTILRLMGKVDEQNRPKEELAKKGFLPFPGRAIKEVIAP